MKEKVECGYKSGVTLDTEIEADMHFPVAFSSLKEMEKEVEFDDHGESDCACVRFRLRLYTDGEFIEIFPDSQKKGNLSLGFPIEELPKFIEDLQQLKKNYDVWLEENYGQKAKMRNAEAKS